MKTLSILCKLSFLCIALERLRYWMQITAIKQNGHMPHEIRNLREAVYSVLWYFSQSFLTILWKESIARGFTQESRIWTKQPPNYTENSQRWPASTLMMLKTSQQTIRHRRLRKLEEAPPTVMKMAGRPKKILSTGIKLYISPKPRRRTSKQGWK